MTRRNLSFFLHQCLMLPVICLAVMIQPFSLNASSASENSWLIELIQNLSLRFYTFSFVRIVDFLYLWTDKRKCISLAADEIAQCLEAASGSKFLPSRKNLLGAAALAWQQRAILRSFVAFSSAFVRLIVAAFQISVLV